MPTVQKKRPAKASNLADVLTLKEAASYLRVSVAELKSLAQRQAVPSRSVGKDWRFLKSALDEWLRGDEKPKPGTRDRIRALAGSMKDDPDYEEMLAEIYKNRGRPMLEDT